MDRKQTTTKQPKTLYQILFKRFFDILFSLLLLIIASPILLIVFIIQKIQFKGGSAFLKQYRPGKNGKIFRLYKFKSMKDTKDANGQLLPDNQRITKFGKFLRKSNIDELPQLLNILKGDMSFIGPRPRLVKDMIFYDKEVIEGYNVRPGITGLSQISGGRSTASWEDIFQKDLEYSKRITFFGDIKILFKTVFALFSKEGKGAGDGAGSSKRDYYYSDYLLRTGKITKEQYDQGLLLAEDVISSKKNIEFQQNLH